MLKRLILCLLGLLLISGLASACGSRKTATALPPVGVTDAGTSPALKPTIPPLNAPTGIPSEEYPAPSGLLPTAPSTAVLGEGAYPLPGATSSPGTPVQSENAYPLPGGTSLANPPAQPGAVPTLPAGLTPSGVYPGPATTAQPAVTLPPSPTGARTLAASPVGTATPTLRPGAGTPVAAGSPAATGRAGGGPTFTPGPTPTERPFTTAEPPPAVRPRTVTIWHAWDEWERLTLEDVLKAFQQFHPEVQFDVLYVPHDELLARYQRAASEGRGPAVLMGPAEWGGVLYEAGQVTDLADIAQPEFLEAIYPAALGEVQYQGALIGLPHTIRSGVVLFRNKQILPQPVSTFDEMVRASRQASQGGKVGAYLERSFFFSAAHLYGLGGELADETGNPAFNDAAGLSWLRLLEDFEQAGATEFDANRDLALFMDGRVGWIIESSLQASDLAEAIGEKNLVIDPWPAYGSGHLSGFVQTDNLYLNPNITGDNQYAALQFMGFFLAREVQAILTRAGHMPSVTNVEIDDPIMEQALRAFEGGTPYPIHPEIPLYWDPLETALVEVLNGSADPVEALDKAVEDILFRIESQP